MSGPLLKLTKAQRERIARELRRGEIVLWAAQPRWTSALPAAALKLAFGLFVGGFVLIWEGAALAFFWDAFFGANRSKTPPALAAVMTLFGLPFVLIALAGLWSPVRLLREARATLYAVTTQRLLVLVGDAGGRTQSILPAGIRRIDRRSFPWLGEMLTVTHGIEPDSEGDRVESTWLNGLDDAGPAEAALRALAAAPASGPPPTGAPRPA